jgi:hypothetical protein
VDDDLEVPGSNLTGEAVGNYGFRCVNYKGRKEPDLFYIYRSMVNGVRLYGSDLDEDLQANEVQNILQSHSMFAAPAIEARGQKAKPGMISHISAMLKIAGHGTENDKFNITKEDLDWVLNWHDQYYASAKGVDGGYLLTFGRFATLCRDQDIAITKDHELEFFTHMKRYGSPKAFHDDCKQRYKKKYGGWSDACLLSIWIKDYMKRGGTLPTPTVPLESISIRSVPIVLAVKTLEPLADKPTVPETSVKTTEPVAAGSVCVKLLAVVGSLIVTEPPPED